MAAWRVCLLAFFYLPVAALFHGTCSTVKGNVCVVTGNRTITRELKLRWTGSIEFRGARWLCASRSSFESVRIDIAIPGTLSLLEGSLLHCATVVIQAKVVIISDTSEISANGTAHSPEPNANVAGDATGKLWSSPQRGASHGGLGGSMAGCSGEDAQLQKRLSLVYGDPFAPWQFGRAAGGGNVGKRSPGGGRISVKTYDRLVLNGTLSASGVAPEEADDDEGAACGSGGSIWITSNTIQQPSSQPAAVGNTGEVDFVEDLGTGASAVQKGRVLAVGGCCRRCLCGGGGRVLTEVDTGSVPRNVIVAGGCFREALKMDGEGCRCGSAGTWTFHSGVVTGKKRRLQGSQQSRWKWPWEQAKRATAQQNRGAPVYTLRVDNSYAVHLAGAKLPQPTPLPAFHDPISLQVNDALVVPSDQDATWLLAGLALLSDQTGSTLKHLGAGPLLLNFSKDNDGLELAFSSIIQARELRILGPKHITLRQNAAIDSSVASLEALEEINAHQGALGQGEGVFDLRAQRVLLGSGRLRAASIFVEQDLVLKRGSRLQSSQRRCDQLPTSMTDPCDLLLSAGPIQNQTLADNVSFDIVLASRQGNIVVEEDAEMYAGAFLLCSRANVSVRGLVSALGLGCAPNRGEGPGAAPQETTPRQRRQDGICGGGGGGHCGNGGDGVHNKTRQRCPGTGGLKYDGWWTSEVARAKPSRLPTWSASGGGGDAAGAGGGIVWIRASVLDMPSNTTSISANGEDASSRVEGSHEGSGGGSGGTVIINATTINGSGMIKAAGGKGGGCVGGGGGGGAIGSAGPNASEAWAAFTGSLDVQGGTGDTSLVCGRQVGGRGLSGELLQLGVCRPGHAGIFCAECAAGTYNPPQGPENLTALFRMCLPCKNKPTQGYYTATGWLNESCPYACPSGFPPVEVNPDCDDPWSYYFAFFGGVWGVAVLILLTAVLFGLLVSAKRVQTRRRLQWLQKQRHTGRQFVGMNDEAMLLFESLRGRHPLADLDIGDTDGTVSQTMAAVNSLRSRTVGESRPRWFLGYVASIWRKIRHRNRRGSDLKEAHLLNVGDLPHHNQRIYLQGENSPRDPWRLSPQPPEELRGLVDENRWADFALQVNCRCCERMRSQLMAEGVLRWLYLPVAEYFRWHLRFSRAADVAAYVWSLSEASGANESLWSLSIPNPSRFALKFGTDREMTLAYVDVLDYSKTLEDWAIKPTLPMVIAAAGDGEYTAPYHLDYADPFVQSVGQYLGRRIWHQVLLPFNLLARLLPPNPTEEDLRPLFKSMQRVSSRVLLQTDIECHAVLFESLVPKTSHKAGRRRPGPDATPVGRQSSWDMYVEAAIQIESNRTSISGLNGSELKTPSGMLTPVLQPMEHTMRRRLALVLTQRANHMSASSRLVAPTSGAKLRAVMPAPAACLVSPTECLNFVQSSPGFCPSPMPDVPELPELERASSTYQDFDSMLRQRSCGRGGPALTVAFRDCGWSGESEPLSPQTTVGTLADSGPEEVPRRRRPRSGRCQCCQRLLPMFRELGGAFCVTLVQRVEAGLYFLAAPGNHFYNWYLRKLKAFNALGGVGRQAGLYLRHRKPRGSQEYTLLMLVMTLLIATLGFIAQSAILFRLQPRHSAFFAALLLPPFADLLALVNTTLFLCGAADGTTCCLFVVASNWNSAIGLLYRIMAMDTWKSSGLLHVLGEYLIVFSVKVSMCRLVNMTIAYYEAEPALLEPGGDDADHEWVKEHVLFRPAVSSMRERARSLTAGRPPPLEEGYAEQNSRSWLMKGLDSSTSEHRPLAALISDLTEHAEHERPSPSGKRSPRLGEHSMPSGDSVSDGWTPLLKQLSSSKPSFHFDRTESPS